MGFSFKKWSKHAFKIPKAIRKMKGGDIIKGAAKGFVEGGPAGAIAGATTASKAEFARVQTDLAHRSKNQPVVTYTTDTLATMDISQTPQSPGQSLMQGPAGAPPWMWPVLVGGGLLVV